MRGLKSHVEDVPDAVLDVAPFMGAWIEILDSAAQILALCVSHPSWVRGLKFRAPGAGPACPPGRTLHGCVD